MAVLLTMPGWGPRFFQLRASKDPNYQGPSNSLTDLHGEMAEGRSQRLSDTPSGAPSVQTVFIK